MQDIVDDIMTLSGTVHEIDNDPLFTSKQRLVDRILGHLFKDTHLRHVRTDAQLKAWAISRLLLYVIRLYLHMMAITGRNVRYATVSFI